MLIKELCAECTLTKKAVEYYTEQGLLFPKSLENGYRIFNDNDVICAKKISVLRRIGLSIDEIKAVFSSQPHENELAKIACKKSLNIEADRQRLQLLEELSHNGDFQQAHNSLASIEQNKRISDKLLDIFPGYFGGYFSLHFSSFLTEPITTLSQLEAFNIIVEFLDNMPSPVVPPDLQEYIDEYTKLFDTKTIQNVTAGMQKSLENPKQFLSENKKTLSDYADFKDTDEFKNSVAYKVSSLLQEFCSTSGYYDVFIPAMRRLSTSYNEYQLKIEQLSKLYIPIGDANQL